MRTAAAVRAIPHLRGARIDLTWHNPPAADFADGAALAGVRVVRQERTFPLDPDDGHVVRDGSVVDRASDTGLMPLRTYYYTVFTRDTDGRLRADAGARASAFATADFGSADQLYGMLPAVHQRADQPLSGDRVAAMPAPVRDALAALPPELRRRGQLYRFLSAAAAPLDLARSFAEGLRRMHDPASIPAEFLPSLANWVGWELNRSLPVFAQRNEVSFAPPLYRAVGTVPGVRAIVNRYTGWHVQVAELAQSIARSNAPAQLNVFAVHERAPGTWRGTDDAAAVLGFVGATDGGADTVTGDVAEPFALRPGMRLTVTADDRVPVTVVFGTDDFADIAHASAAEVAAVLDRTLSEVTASAVEGKLVLASHRGSETPSVRVEESAASLVTLEGAPCGRLCPLTGADGQLRLFYATARTPPPEGRAEVRVKTFRAGWWGGSIAVPTGPAATDPAAVALGDGRVLLVWVDSAGTGARLRWTTGRPRSPRPAVLVTRRSAPFAIRPDTRLVVRTNGHRRGLVLTSADFPDPDRVDAATLAGVLAGRLPVTATAQRDGTVALRSAGAGGDQRLAVDLAASDAAAALGFDATNAEAAGEWGDELDWSAALDVLVAPPAGRVAEPVAVADGPDAVRLFWSAHDGARWTIATARWQADAWGPPKVLAAADGGNVEPAVVRGADGQLVLFWARRDGVGTRDDRWVLRRQVLDPAGNWGPEAGLTTPSGALPGREPAPVLVAGALRLYFRSRQLGGADVWRVDLAADAVTAGAPEPVLTGPAADQLAVTVAAPAAGPDPHWLLFRSDRGVALSGLATREIVRPDGRVTAAPAAAVPAGVPPADLVTSVRAVDTGTQARFAGTSSAVPDDAARNGRRGRWDDLAAYTPNRPRGGRLSDTELYTRGTLALYLSPVVPDSPVTLERERQLRPLLERFLPVGARAVVVFAPRDTVELVYRPDAELTEVWRRDVHPFLEAVPGAVEEATAAALPDWVQLRATTAGHLSADPADLATLAFRVWFAAPS